MDISIDKLFEMLNWNCDEKTQAQGRTLASQINDLSLFLQPMAFGSKAVWDNCARILAEKTDNVLEPYLVHLLEWLQDINWPGAFIILDRLKIFSSEMIKEPLQFSVRQAINKQDNAWLDYLSELLDNPELSKALTKDCWLTLKKHYHNWGNE